MKIAERAAKYCGVYFLESTARGEGFEAGAEWLREEIKDFIKANPKITADKITEYLNSL